MRFLFYISMYLLVKLCEGYKILVVYPFPASSHNILGTNVVRHLLKAGHEVTYITPFPWKEYPSNLHQIDVSSTKDAYPMDTVNLYKLMHNEVVISSDSAIFYAVMNLVDAVIRNENVQKLINDPTQKFDIVVNEYIFNDLYAGFAAVFECPYIWILPYEPYVKVLSLIDGPPNPAYAANAMSDNTPPFTFIQRLQELWSAVESIILNEFFYIPIEKKVYKEVFGPAVAERGQLLPPFEDVIYNASMILGNTHVSTGVPLQYPQSYKSIAGYFIEEDVKPLPENLKNIMDNAKNGVIYFSLGSNLKSKDFPEEIKQGLLKVFSERQETILWKYEGTIKNTPKNVFILKWTPQQSVLAHPNCKLFITHGGLLSITESVHFGVPIIGIPVYVDQFNNVNRLVQKGAGLRVDISYSLADDLKIAIQEITGNYRFTEKATEVSLVYHDRPVSPGAELVHWVEHVVRTRGAPFLRSPALTLPFYKKMYLDLVFILVVLLLLLTYIKNKIITLFVKNKKKSVTKKKK